MSLVLILTKRAEIENMCARIAMWDRIYEQLWTKTWKCVQFGPF